MVYGGGQTKRPENYKLKKKYFGSFFDIRRVLGHRFEYPGSKAMQ
jgi:hypothetical protein